MYDFIQARAALQLLHGVDSLIEFRFPWPFQRVKAGEKRPAPYPMGTYIDAKTGKEKDRYAKIIYAFDELTDELLNQFKAGNEKGHHVFFCINKRINRNVSTNEDMETAGNLCNNICIDFDPDKVIVPEGRTFGIEFLQSLIAKVNLPTPTCIKSTGTGFHAWWHLAEPISIDRWKKIQSDLDTVLPVDGATDKPSGMMRLAGFVNAKHENDIRDVTLIKNTINLVPHKAEDIEKCLSGTMTDKEILELAAKLKTKTGKAKAKTTANKENTKSQSDKSYPFLLQKIDVYKLLDHFKIWYPKDKSGSPLTDSNNQPVICITPNQHEEVQDHPHGLIGLSGKAKGQYNCFCCQKKDDTTRGTIVDVICYHLHKDKFPDEDYSREKHGALHYYKRVVVQIDKMFPGFINTEFGELESPINLLKTKLLEYNFSPTEKENTWISDCPICKKRTLNIYEHKSKDEIVVNISCLTCCKNKSPDEKAAIFMKLFDILKITFKDLKAKRKKHKAYSFRYSEPNINSEVEIIPMKDAFNVNNIASGKVFCFRGRVSAAKDNPCAIPTVAKFYCKDYGTNACLKCGVFEKSIDSPDSLIPDPISVTLDITNQELLDLMGQAPKKERITQQILRSINVFNCRNTFIYVEKNMNIYDIWAVPEDEREGGSKFEGMVFVANHTPLKMQSVYRFFGKLIKHPKTSMTVFAAYNVEREKTRVESEEITPEDKIEAANNFRPKTNDLIGLDEAIKNNIQDFERGVSKVFKSFDMHLAKFITCNCPVTKFNYGGNEKWAIIDSAVIGDSGMAKTQVSNKIIEELQYGHNLDHSNATLPGLLGGRNKKDNGQFYQENGDFCIYDKDWIVCEEFVNNPEAIKIIMPSIRKTRTDFQFIDSKMGGSHKPVWARCSKTFERNPQLHSLIENFPYGILALKEIATIRGDIRRFDFALIISKKDTKGWNEELEEYESYEKKYSARSRQVVLYTAKKLKTDDIVFDNDYLKICREFGMRLADTYSDEIALCSRDVISEKLARLAVSLAAWTFNYSKDGKLLVSNHYIEYAFNWLNKIYSSDACGFKRYSDRVKQTAALMDENEVKDLIRKSRSPNEFIAVLLETPPIAAKYMKEIIEMFDVNVNQAELIGDKVLRMLAHNRALKMDKYGKYRITTGFVKALKELKDEKLPDSNPLNQSCGTEYG